MADQADDDPTALANGKDEAVLVIDNGSGSIKAGYSTDDVPTVVFPSVVGRPRRRYESMYAGSPAFVGEEAMANRNHLSFTCAIDHGHIDDWAEVEEIWNHAFAALGTKSAGRCVLMTEPPLCSTKHREKMAELMFEVYDVAELNLSVTGLMALYGIGQQTGFVLDIGEGITQCVPVYDGYVEKGSIKRSDFAGQELSMYLQKILCDMGYPMTTRDDMEHIRVIKETICFNSLNPAEEQYREDLDCTYTLPDGMTLRDGATTEITLGPERFYPPEALFNPQLFGRDNQSLTDLIWSSILACPMDIRKALIKSVVLSGGSTMFRGFPERLEKELKNTAPPQARSVVSVIAPPNRQYTVWRGARMYCAPSMRSLLDHVWVTKEEWDEIGMKIVHQKANLKIGT